MKLVNAILITLGISTMTTMTSSCFLQPMEVSPGNSIFVTNSGYPEFIRGGQCEIWRYVGNVGTRVEISFLDLSIKSEAPICDGGWLKIGPVGKKKYCGTSRTEMFTPYDVVLTSAQPLVYIFLNTSRESAISRFRLKVEVYPANFDRLTTLSASVNSSYRHQRSSMSIPEAWDEKKKDCNHVLTSVKGVFTSSSDLYTDLRNYGQCSWLLRAPSSTGTVTRYTISFDRCSIPQGDIFTLSKGGSESRHTIASYSRYRRCPVYLDIASENVLFTYRSHQQTPDLSRPVLNIFYSREVECKKGYYHCGDGETDCYPMMASCDGVKDCLITGLDEINGCHYETRNQDTPSLPLSRETPATQGPLPYMASKRWNVDRTCNFLFTSSGGVIASTTDLYSALMRTEECSWLLHTPKNDGTVIHYRLHFNYCHFPRGNKLSVYEGETELRTFDSYCPRGYMDVYSNDVQIIYRPDQVRLRPSNLANFSISFIRSVSCMPGYKSCGQGELTCYHKAKACDGVLDCPVRGEDEKGCLRCLPHEYSCNSTLTYCYTDGDRCNGKEKCANHMDELNCTPEQCSKEKGLYLCRNKRCIFEKWRCDHTRDCADGSDEEDCSSAPSPRVIVAAVVGATTCALVLVVVFGCICKICNVRMNPPIDTGHIIETPLTRLQAELFRRRAPPPPYNEAMLTSRPYEEAYQELLRQAELRVTDSIPQSQERGQRRRSRRHRNRFFLQGSLNPTHTTCNQVPGNICNLAVNQNPPTEGDSALQSILHSTDGANRADTQVPPPYTMLDPRVAYPAHVVSSSSSSDADSVEEDYLGRDDDVPLLDLGSETTMNIEMTSAAVGGSPQTVINQSSSNPDSLSENVHPLSLSCPLVDFMEENLSEDNNKEVETASTSLSNDSNVTSQLEVTDKVEENLPSSTEDSDTDCILDANKTDSGSGTADGNSDDDENIMNADTESDTARLIP